jgi:hypothetical protein
MLSLGAMSAAHAQARLYADATACSVLQATVARDQSALIYTGPNLYARYVAWCSPQQQDIPAYVRSRDTAQCLVGYTCRQNSN